METRQMPDERDKTELHLKLSDRWIALVNDMIGEGYCPRDVTEAMATALGSALVQTHGADEAWLPAFSIYAPLRQAATERLPDQALN